MDTVQIIKVSAWVMDDLESRILMDIRSEMPNLIIETQPFTDKARIVKVKVNAEGL